MVCEVVVVGAINTDLVITSPHLPTPGETVVGGGLQTFGGGKGANAAVAAARAGASVYLVGAIGADDQGKSALAALQGDGIDTSGVAVLNDEPTGAALIVVDQKGENQIVIGPGANGAVTSAHVHAALADLLRIADVVLVSTEIPLAAIRAAIEAAAQAEVQCVLNPAPVISGIVELLPHHPILTPNEMELRGLVRALSDSATADGTGDETARHLRHLGELTVSPVIVTLGAQGCAVRLADGTINRIPAKTNSNVVDTTGAGDTFNGVLAARLAAGDELMIAVSTAVTAASLSVSMLGAREGMPSAAAITDAMS
ncbi:MAG: PfkB family carbohydrate kinase [Gammaproteobacteria bacterium]